MVTQKCAGQQRKLRFLHLALESVKKALQQQDVHVLCVEGRTRVTPLHLRSVIFLYSYHMCIMSFFLIQIFPNLQTEANKW